MKKILLFLFIIVGLFANDKQVAITTKQVCAVISDYPGKTVAQFKQILLNKAKQEALNELYGQLIYTQEDLKNGKLISEEVRDRAIGAVRIKGNPQFFNGKSFGELCVKITAYATKKDLEMYSPKKVTLKHFCYTNPNVPLKKVKEEAKYAAFKEIVSEFNPKLNINGKEAENYIHQFQILNDKFDFNTMSYCFDATATILPYELQLAPGKLKKTKKAASAKKQAKKINVNYPAYFDNYVWEGIIKKTNGNENVRVKMFFLNKEKTLMMIIFFDNGSIYTNIFKGKINGIKVFYQREIYQELYNSDGDWIKVSGILINNQIKGVIDDNDYDILMKKTNERVKDYFSEIWIGRYDTTKFKNGKIILLRNDEIKNYWADMYPTQGERGTDTYYRTQKNGIDTFSDIEGYDPINGYDYDSFSFTGTMVAPNKFLGAGTGNFVTKIELTRVK